MRIRVEIEALQKAGKFKSAAVGKGHLRQLNPEIRGDGTFWFEPDHLTPAQTEFVSVIESVRKLLNEQFYLGLEDWEGHYAIYPPGAFYERHLDRFKSDSRRKVSMVFFFNSDWKSEEGGALKLDLGEKNVEVLPESGTAVFFMSDLIPHEVCKTFRERLSFAGWFRTREYK
jgi:SM-20-related protein